MKVAVFHSSSVLGIVSLFNFTHSIMCVVVFRCGFNLICMSQWLVMVSIIIFPCAYLLSMSFLVKHLLKLLLFFKLDILFSCWWDLRILYVLDTSLSLDICFINISSLCMACFFNLLPVSFEEQDGGSEMWLQNMYFEGTWIRCGVWEKGRGQEWLQDFWLSSRKDRVAVMEKSVMWEQVWGYQSEQVGLCSDD